MNNLEMEILNKANRSLNIGIGFGVFGVVSAIIGVATIIYRDGDVPFWLVFGWAATISSVNGFVGYFRRRGNDYIHLYEQLTDGSED